MTKRNGVSRMMRWKRRVEAVSTAMIVFGFFVFTAPAWGWSTGIPGYAGAPGDPVGVTRDCTFCHSVQGSFSGEVSVIPFESQVMASELIQIEVIYEGDTPARWGFDLIALDDATGQPVGQLIAGGGSQIMTSAVSWEYLTHTLAGTLSTVDNTPGWVVEWLAPSSEVDSVTFYAAFNAANGNGSRTRDNIFTTVESVSVVPEPGGMGVALASLATLSLLYRYRARRG